MEFNSFFIQTARQADILQVAHKLGIDVKKRGINYVTHCFIHDDTNPSLYISPAKNIWSCFACGMGGDPIALVMKHQQIGFVEALRWLVEQGCVKPPQQAPKFNHLAFIESHCMDLKHSNYLDPKLIETYQGYDNELTQALVNNHILTREQMHRAAERFRLCTAGKQVIFWYIDANGNLCEGKSMAYQADAHRSKTRKPFTISYLLKQKRALPEEWSAQNCLFGLHQLNQERFSPVAVVESEKTAIICSEQLADERFLWMASGGFSRLSAKLLEPLKGRKVILIPDTDADGTAYQGWLRKAEEAKRLMDQPITVSDLLERFATGEEKSRKIDLADFLIARLDD